MKHGARKIKGAWISIPGFALDLRATRITQTDELRDLVESLSCSVVDGLAKHPMLAETAGMDEHGMSARNHQRHECFWIELRGIEMRFHVMDRDECFSETQCKSACGRNTHQQRAGEPGAARDSNGIKLTRLNVGSNASLSNDGVHHSEMLARSHFRNDASIDRVQIHLGGNDVGKRLSIAHNRGGGFVTGSFEAEKEHGREGLLAASH